MKKKERDGKYCKPNQTSHYMEIILLVSYLEFITYIENHIGNSMNSHTRTQKSNASLAENDRAK